MVSCGNVDFEPRGALFEVLPGYFERAIWLRGTLEMPHLGGHQGALRGLGAGLTDLGQAIVMEGHVKGQCLTRLQALFHQQTAHCKKYALLRYTNG